MLITEIRARLYEEMGNRIAEMMCLCITEEQTHMPFEMVSTVLNRCSEALSIADTWGESQFYGCCFDAAMETFRNKRPTLSIT